MKKYVWLIVWKILWIFTNCCLFWVRSSHPKIIIKTSNNLSGCWNNSDSWRLWCLLPKKTHKKTHYCSNMLFFPWEWLLIFLALQAEKSICFCLPYVMIFLPARDQQPPCQLHNKKGELVWLILDRGLMFNCFISCNIDC